MAQTLKLAQLFRRAFRRPSFRLMLFAAAALLLAGRGAMRPFVQAQTNPIVVENGLPPGTLESWDVAGAGDPSIQGFATDISVNTGDTVFFKVKTNAVDYKIDIFRLGYYGSAGARLVTTVVPSASLPQNQPACAVNGTTGLADCGNWGVSASWTATNAVSGIYLGKLTRPDTGGSSHIVFIVRDDLRQADVIVQTSDTSWQAYNQYGGGSLYCGGPVSNGGTVYSCAGRATEVSYNRPFDTRAHDATSFLFNAEYPMVRFLEANGYDVKYISGVDTERRAADLIGAKKPKAFFSVGHDEYWSAGQRASVEAARDAGVSLAFFSGNEMYWKTRFEPAGDGTPYRTLVGYKDTLAHGVKIDPSAVSTGTWRDMRLSASGGGRPENGLTGQIWTVNSGTSAISVPASMANLRFWRNTRVATLGSGVATLAPETLGYEWDEDLDNGARPSGLIHLSSTTVSNVEKILDYGETVGLGTATHNLTLYKHASGALVFGAGTVQWTWGLDSTHDRGANPPDQAMQQATVNLLADMGAQAGSLQTGLIATSKSMDLNPPTSTVTSPAAGGTVGSGTRVTITGTAGDSDGVVAGVEVSVDGGTTWRAAQGVANWSYEWLPGAIGQATIRTRAIDDSGNIEAPGAGSTVIVNAGDCPCPSLWAPTTVPAVADAADESPLELGVKFRSDVNGFVKGVRFYKSLANTGTHIGNLWSSTGANLATATFTGESLSGWQEVLFDVPVAVTANSTYVASYHTNVGHYAATGAYFSSLGVDRSPLHAPPSNTVGGNGVFIYGVSAFPTGTFNATNYWVDVVFDSTPDTAAPQIGDVRATPVDSSVALVTWTTDEAATSSVDYSPDATFATQTQTVSNAAFVMAHSVRLTGLRPSTAYFFRVRSTDRAGNSASLPSPGGQPTPGPGGQPLPPQGFTMPSPMLHDTVSADFSAGTGSGTYVSETADGELILAPGHGSEFSGTTMPAGWATRIWSDGGSAVVRGGKLTVDGARVASCVDVNGACVEQFHLVPGTSLEFGATFTGDPYQHSGLGQTLEVSFEPMALFSTSWTDIEGVFHSGGSLGVRTYNGTDGAGEIRTNLGAGLLNAPHRFRIDWLPLEVVYSVDGVEVARHATAITAGMRPVAASDFNAYSGTVVVDSVRTSPYASSASFLSRVFDGSTTIDWQTISWVASQPAGTSLAISVRTGETPTPDGSWNPFTAIAAPGALGLQSRYIQYRVEMATAAANQTPALEDISIRGVAPPLPSPTITPTIAWPTPAAISYGTALGATQLNAAVTPAVDGTFTYSPAAGSVLDAGNHGVTVTFTPADTTRYTSANATVMITVQKVTPTITWSPPVGITYGTALGAAQQNATANALGTFAYTPAPGTVLHAGAGQTLSAAFTPNDATNYHAASATVSITVGKATPLITWNPPAGINYGTALGATQLNATANVPGSFAYAPPSGTVLAAGPAQPLSAAFTPSNSADYNGATAGVTIAVVKPTGAVTVTSSNSPSLFGAPITLTATVVPTTATGTVSFRDGANTIACEPGSSLNAPVAICKTSTMSIATHSITAVYTGSTNVAGSTSAAISQVITPSAKLLVKFSVYALQDNTSRPKVVTIPVPNATVKVFSTANACVGTIFVALDPKKWGKIFDGADGPGGVDGCLPVSYGAYQATGTTDANGNATIIVPPLAFSWATQYLPIARATNFDYVKTATSPDPLYSTYPVLYANPGEIKSVPLALLATFGGKIVPGSQTEFFGSYLDIIQPEYVEWTDDQEKYPFVMVAEGDWSTTTNVAAPGTVADAPALSAGVVDTTSAVQFTLTDAGTTGSIDMTVNHSILHKGETKLATSSIATVNKRATLARADKPKMMVNSGPLTIPVLTNDRIGGAATSLVISGYTTATNGTVTTNDEGTALVYTPNAGFSGPETFTYTISDDIGMSSTATVTVTVLAIPQVSVKNGTVTEGDTGSNAATITIALSNQSVLPVTVNYQTLDGNAAAGVDYVAASGTVTFLPGDVSEPISVDILGDRLAEFNEKFSVRLSGPTNATIAAAPGGDITISDDDPPEISIAAAASINEGSTGSNNVALVVTLSQTHFESVFVNYATVDGTARAGSDYINTTGTLQFYPGTLTKTIYVPVFGDTVGESTESFYVDLSTPLNGMLTQPRASVFIVNDDNSTQVVSTAADLAGGTVAAGAYISETTGGEIILAPSQASEFSGGSLPAGWTLSPLADGALSVVANGTVTVSGGALLAPVMAGSGRTLEFVAAFSGTNQNVGFGTSGTLSSPMAMFVVKGDHELYAITVNGARTVESPMSGIDWLNKSHRYQITWNAGNAQYYIDGTLMMTHASMAWGAVTMRPVIADTIAGDGGVAVDWIRVTPYAGSGGYTSAVFDAGEVVAWQKLTTTSTVPSGTTSTITYRTGTTLVPDETWTPFTALGTGGVMTGSSRYVQFAIQMTTTAVAKTPTIQDVTMQFKR